MLRWAFRCQSLLHKMEQEFHASGGDPKALRDLRATWSQISDKQRWCVEHSDTDVRAAIMCSKLAGVGGSLLDLHLSRFDLIRWREAGLAGARKANLVEDEIGHLTYLSYLYFVNNNPERALELIDEAIKLTTREGNLVGKAAALQTQGMFFARMGR